MTYQEKHDDLQKNVSAAWGKLLEADKELSSTSGFGDIDSVPAYNRAYNDWQYAANNYNNFLSWLRGRKINPDDSIS